MGGGRKLRRAPALSTPQGTGAPLVPRRKRAAAASARCPRARERSVSPRKQTGEVCEAKGMLDGLKERAARTEDLGSKRIQ